MPSSSSRELDWLYSSQVFGIKLGLEGTQRLLKACGVAQAPEGCRVIHVAGSNGKGSSCAFAESIARASGYRTGFFSSPHLIRFNERIRVGGEMIADADVNRLIRKLRVLTEDWESKPTFFEYVFALAMIYFSEQGCNLLILETGLGGRLDATNAIDKDIALLAPITFEHTQYLGDTLTAIASEKAGIIHRGVQVISSPQEAEVEKVIDARCAKFGCQLEQIQQPISDKALGLYGAHQSWNAALALAGIEQIARLTGHELKPEHIELGLASTCWPGRYERCLSPAGAPLILDGAHNPHAMHVLKETWQSEHGEQRCNCIFAASADKELGEMVTILSPIVKQWILPPVNSPRIMPAAELAELIEGDTIMPESLGEALDGATRDETTLVCGSFFLLGELAALMEESPYRSTQQ